MYLIKVIVEHNTLALNNYFYYYSNEEIKVGIRIHITFNNQQLVGFVLEVTKYNCSLKELEDELGLKLSLINNIIDDEPILTDELIELAIKLSKFYFYPLIGVLQTILPSAYKPKTLSKNFNIKYNFYYKLNKEKLSDKLNKNQLKLVEKFNNSSILLKNQLNKSKTLDDFIKKGIIEIKKEEKYRYKIDKIFNYKNNFVLNESQNKIFNEYKNSNDSVYLLYGITGSGKTEIYIKMVEEALNKNKKALILVPEIALTPLMISRILSYFDEDIAVLHSSLSDVEKYDEYRKIKNNNARIVIGTRSAIFAPLNEIGLIIIDEENSDTYIEENYFPYDAKEIAILRAKYFDAKVILGSATPLITDMAKAKNKRYHLLTLEERYNSKDLPVVRLIDRKNFNNFSYKSSIFSLELIKEIKSRIEKQEQIILFINARGYERRIYCRECGETFKCPHCNIDLVYHKFNDRLVCHHCGYNIKKPIICPLCGSKYISYMDYGIEKVEEDFKKIFNIPYLVLDQDRTPKSMQISTILSKFNKKEALVLIGTQIVSKGHDFDDVTLVGIINADTLLSYPTYKTRENAFSLIMQTVGRAGRKEKNGLALIQTSFIEDKTINYAIASNYLKFYENEMINRKIFNYPPFLNVLKIQIESKKEELIDPTVDDIINYIKYQNLDILINKANKIYYSYNKFIGKIFIRYKTISILNNSLTSLINLYRNKSNILIKINLNPLDY